MSAISVAILEEIGFEGLDGITFEALWKRLEKRDCFYNHENFFDLTWKLVIRSDYIEFYQLPEPRKPIQVVDRRDDEDFVEPEEFYSWKECKMQTAEGGVMGICSFFQERVLIPKDTVRNVTYWGICGSFGSTFIMVATQEYRESLLFPENVEKPPDFASTAYAMMEIIGKSRFRGETTNGPCALQHFMRDSGMIFYFKRKLLRCGVITQQIYCRTVPGHGLQRSVLLHLPRFYKEHKSKYCLTIEKIAEYLKLQPNLIASYDDVKRMLVSESLEASSKKLLRMKDFQKFVVTDIRIPYRQLYPSAPESQCVTKNKVEKIVRAMQLRDPHVDVTKFWMKDDQQPDDEEDVYDPEMVIPRLVNVPLLKQIYQEVENSGEKGLSQTDVRKIMGLTRLQARAVMQNMLKMHLLKVYQADEGRQRMARYILPKYHVDLKQRVAQEPVEECGDEILVDEPSVEEPVDGQNQDSLLQQMLINTDDASGEILHEIEEMDGMMRSKRPITDKITSVRMLQRLKMVEQLVEKRLIFTDIAQITRIIIEREKKRGQKETVCRKTLEKIVTILRRTGRVNILRITLKSTDIVKVLWFICHKSVAQDHSLVQQAIVRAKAMIMIQKMRKEGKQSNHPEVILPTDEIPPGMPAVKAMSSGRFTNVPKFVRLRLLHEFLFYIVYELPQDNQPLDQAQVLEEWREIYPFNDVTDNLPPLFSSEFDWKMFIPPLVRNHIYPPGWVLFQDVLLRIPLTLLVKMFFNKQLSLSVQKILEHPIRRNMLLSQLPSHIRMMFMRSMIYSRYIYEVLRRLCFMGLVQLGPQSTNTTMSAHIFINRNASVINTSSSSPGYIHIEEKKYPMTMFHFSSLEVVEKYWDELMMVSFATRLGYRKNHEGKEVIVEVLHTKPAILATLIPRQPHEAIERDTGEIPGDHLGAGGLDCSFFAHIKGSWKGKKKRKQAQTNSLADIKPPLIKLESKKVSSITKRSTANLVQAKGLKTWRAAAPKSTPRIRTITRKKQTRIRTTNYDEIDRKAISMMKTLRVTWTAEEDNVLLLCKIATLYFHDSRKVYVSGHTIRDILHFHMNSIHMTSRACTRRIVYMMKNPATKMSVENCLCEVRENELIRRKFGEDFVEKLKTYYRNEEFVSAMKFHFINLFIILNGMFFRLTSQQMSSVNQRIPNTIGAFWEKFRETNPEKSGLRYADPLTHDEILQSTIYSLIYSSMCTSKDKSPYNLQLFEIYKNYSNEMLGNVMDIIRADQLISYVKSSSRAGGKKVVPLQQGPFHLSNLYQFHLIQHVSYGIYEEMWQMMQKHRGKRLEVVESVPGVCFLFGELFVNGFADVIFEMPKKLLVFSNEAPTDTPYERIASRFHNIMSIVPSVQIEGSEAGQKGKSQKKVAFMPDYDFFIYRQFSVEQLMKLQTPFSHVICFLYYTAEQENLPLDSFDHQIFDKICPYSCLFSEGFRDFSEIIQGIVQMNPEELEKSLESFVEIADQVAREDDRDPGKTQCKRSIPNLLDIFRDLLEEATADQSTWIRQFYQTDGEDDGGDFLPNIWQIRRNLGTYSNIDDFAEKSQRIDNYLVLKDVKIHFEINSRAPILMSDSERDVILEKVRMRSILRCPTRTIEDLLARFEGSLAKCAKCLLDAIIECREFGMTLKAMERRFREFPSTSILTVLDSFLLTGLIIQMGILEYTFIYWKHSHPWLVKSFNVTRLQKEAEENITARVMDINVPSSSTGIKTEEPPAKRARMSNTTAATISIKREDDLREPTKFHDRDTFHLRPYPWIRVNGTLNRRVLDKLLGVVLIFLTKSPGIGLLDLAKRFNYLHPTHLKLLLEVLEDVQCIQIYTMKTSKCTLRSQYQPLEIGKHILNLF
ncbi:hypothetical protein DMENIID0001_034280 [Sergentomyia squamirostris]